MVLSKKNEFENEIIEKKSFCEQDLKHKSFSHVTFNECDFTKSNFTGSKFLECKWENCNLSLTKFDGCRLQDIEFENCKLVGIDFTKCERMFLGLGFKNCFISMANFSDLPLKNTCIFACKILDTFFSAANLSGADFRESDLGGSTFHNTNLSGANFCGAINYLIHPSTNNLSKAKFSTPEVLSLLCSLNIIIDEK